MSETNKAIIKRFIEEYQTGRDETVLYETVALNMVNRTPMTPHAPGGPSEVKQIFDMFHSAFADFAATINDMYADGDRVITYKTFAGTHTGEFNGVPPTGRAVRFDVIDIVRLADGQIVEHWGVVDQLGLLTQLGVLAGPTG